MKPSNCGLWNLQNTADLPTLARHVSEVWRKGYGVFGFTNDPAYRQALYRFGCCTIINPLPF